MSNKDQLHEVGRSSKATRCGATNDPEKRKYGYSRSSVGMSGTMYCLKVDNQYRAENELLGLKHWVDNVQKTSNVHATPGYVYVIVEH